jgi:hypothetical protein
MSIFTCMENTHISDEIECDMLREMYDDDVKQAKNKLLRYLRYTFPETPFEYELVSIGHADGDKFVSRLLIMYPKGKVTEQLFLDLMMDKWYVMSEMSTDYEPIHVDQIEYPDKEMFVFNMDWSISAYKELVEMKRKIQEVKKDAKHPIVEAKKGRKRS